MAVADLPQEEPLAAGSDCAGRPLQECRGLDVQLDGVDDDSEAELLKFSMLQTVLSLGARGRPAALGLSLQPPTQPTGGPTANRQAAILAEGDVSDVSEDTVTPDSAGQQVPPMIVEAVAAADGVLKEEVPVTVEEAHAATQADNSPLSQAETALVGTGPRGLLNRSIAGTVVAAEEPHQNTLPFRSIVKNCSLWQTEMLGSEYAVGGTPLQLQVQLDVLRLAGAFPPRDPLRLAGEEGPSSGQPAVALFSGVLELHPSFLTSLCVSDERFIMLMYMVFYLVSMFMMYYWMMNPPARHTHHGAEFGSKHKTDVDVEVETWRQGLLGWLAVSWASPWVARWGHSSDAARTKINPGDLPQIGNREHQAREACKYFERLWKEEIDAVGEENASVARVIVRIYTIRTMLYLMFVLVCQVLIGQIYSVFLIEHAMTYFYWLQDYVKIHGEAPDVSGQLLASIAAFLALPFSNIVFSSINNSVSCRLDQQICGGLSIALFRKSQRLPSVVQNSETQLREGEEPQVDLLPLINYDVNTNLVGGYQMICLATTSFVALVVLTCLLWLRLHLATLCAVGCAVPIIIFSLYLMSGLGGSFGNLQGCIDKRITALREVLYGIRIVKGYAWEDAMEEKVVQLRREELVGLTGYFHCLGGFLGIFIGFPRILILAGLWGYATIYGQHDVATIFTCMQILSSLRWSCDVFIKSFAQAVVVQPSIQRIEAFLKLPEAPVLLPERAPDWLELWPEAPRESDALSDVDTPKESQLQVCGTFKWREEGPVVLHDLRLQVPRGQLIGVVGAVGSGKSTLLQAVLGELYPDREKPSCVSRPGVIAYCSQVPHIAEGTLKENVLNGQPFEPERYNEAIQSASLKPDLAVLPGGDEVLIGSRGITLSGGQKARVAMARAAYHKGSDLVVIDDPFAAIDAPTAKVIMEQLLLGPLMRDRTRVVTLQPDAQRLRSFNHLIVMERGRIKEQGLPEVVMQTEAYQKLLSTHTEEFSADPEAAHSQGSTSPVKRAETPTHTKLRDEEIEGRPTWDMVGQVITLGRWTNLLSASGFFCTSIYLYLLCDLALARWTNAMVVDPNVKSLPYLLGYLFWLVCGVSLFAICWFFGERFSLGISKALHDKILHRILRAPIDRFFDKHPVGRILNRLSTDMLVVDMYLYVKGSGCCTVVYQILVPIVYVHCIMPWFISIAAVPFYLMMAVFCLRFWNTSVPLRYCMTSARSDVSSHISDVVGNKVVIRAYQDQERITMDMSDAVDNQLKAGLLGDRVLRRWLVNRIIFMWSFYTTTMYMVGVMSASHIGAGTLGICLTNLLLLESQIDAYLDTATGAQFEFIALARLHEYLSVPQEKPMRKLGDARYSSFTAHIPREDLRELTFSDSNNIVEVRRHGAPLLREDHNGTALMVADTAASAGSMPRLLDLCPTCPALGRAEGWHRIVAANGAVRDARAMAREICGVANGEVAGMLTASTEVTLEVQSGWLLEGAHVQIESIKAGYADIPRDVLKGISMEFPRKMKVAIAGTTGCGKSSLLLVLLRVLEPRSGRILLNDVDISGLGLATLRSAVGLVPQDPVLFSGSLRHNLDPFKKYSDGRIWQALRCVHLADVVEEWSHKLEHRISDEGTNLSFGQRQLVCLARMVLRQPGLLLLDEATSAIEPHTQQLVQQTIKSAFPSSTLIAVAHRLETVLDFDHVVVMDHGDVAEQGPVRELVERKDGTFRKMLAAKGSW